MKKALLLLFSLMLVAMLAVTIQASLDRGMMDAGRELMQHGWFRATLADAYFAFVTFYAWVAWRERTIRSRIIWFVLIMCLGSMAMSAYMLIQLWQLRGRPLETIWPRRPTHDFAQDSSPR